MTKTTKIALSALVGGAMALATAQATPITGSIAFSGTVNAFASTNGTGSAGADLTQDHSLVFSSIVVNQNTGPNPTTTGTYLPFVGAPVDFFSPLQINTPGAGQAVLPNQALWTIHNTLYSFTLSIINEPVDQAGLIYLTGTGILSDGNPADNTAGTWAASINQTSVAFSFASTAAAVVPDSGASLMLLGMGVCALAGFAKFRKQVA